jgi:hypothetical protein
MSGVPAVFGLGVGEQVADSGDEFPWCGAGSFGMVGEFGGAGGEAGTDSGVEDVGAGADGEAGDAVLTMAQESFGGEELVVEGAGLVKAPG